jgi:hypothetical protein
MTRPRKICIITIQAIASQPLAPRPKEPAPTSSSARKHEHRPIMFATTTHVPSLHKKSSVCAVSTWLTGLSPVQAVPTKASQRSGQPAAGLASSSTGRNSRAKGPNFLKLWKGLRPAVRNLGPKWGVFRPLLRPNFVGAVHLPAHRGPLGAVGRYCLSPFYQLVEISKRSLQALACRHSCACA